MSRLFVLHYNHQQRVDASVEEKRLQTYFTWHIRSASYMWGLESEHVLRKARWTWVANEVWENTVYTGHHLDDRIETTCMHLLRGCGEVWIQNMSEKDESHTYSIERPLLKWTKHDIRIVVEQCNIPFVEDPSNYDTTYTMRNRLRAYWSNITQCDIYDHMHGLYRYMSWVDWRCWPICELLPHKERQAKHYYSSRMPESSQDWYILLDTISCLQGLSLSFLEELCKFWSTTAAGWKYYQWWYFLRSRWILYLVYTWDEQPFWYTLPIGNTTQLYATPWQSYGSSTVFAALGEQWVPWFRKPYIPVTSPSIEIYNYLLPDSSLCHW